LDQANDKGDNNVSLKTRLIAGVGALTLAAGAGAMIAPAAHAAPVSIGGCGGAAMLGTLTPAITDQTQVGVTAKTKVLKDLTSKAAIGGSCATAVRPGDPIQPAGGPVSFSVKSIATKLLGNASCANGPTATGADATAAAAWPLNGKITYTGTTTNALAKPWQIQADIVTLGFSTTYPDVLNIGGIVLKGAAVGATVGGDIWFDPVAKTGGPTGYNTGYEVDLGSALGCADGTPNNASLSTVMIGGGGASATSLIGSTASGPTFTLGG
jgi:hypothetical protein